VNFDATLTLNRRPWSADALHRALISHPWMTAKVIGAIHWQALRLFLRKAPVFHASRRGPPPTRRTGEATRGTEMIAEVRTIRFLRAMRAITEGHLELVCDGQRHHFGDRIRRCAPRSMFTIARFFRRALFCRAISGIRRILHGWRLDFARCDRRDPAGGAQSDAVESGNAWFSALSRSADCLPPQPPRQHSGGQPRNIRDHYDLNNDFFRLFLDTRMVYSCAWYETPEDTLETAQFQKLDRACRKLQLRPPTICWRSAPGWGAMAIHAAKNYGCRVTTTTISREQYDYAREQIARRGSTGQIELLLKDYRHLQGTYDKLVSIEMFEAVGFEFYDTFFQRVRPFADAGWRDAAAGDHNQRQEVSRLSARADWIQKYIFPGSQLASVSGVCASLARATNMSLYHAEDMGTHYARTLRAWSERFHDALDRCARWASTTASSACGISISLTAKARFSNGTSAIIQFLLTKSYAQCARC
jgi:cyclopropane-fatty-acyl-phospholipid synthase